MLEQAALGLVQDMGEATQFSGEFALAIGDFAQMPGTFQNALRHLLPVHAPHFNACVVKIPRPDPGLAELFG